MSQPPSWRRYGRFWGARVDADVDDELRFHLEMRTRDYRARGMTQGDARRAAMARLGDVARTREACVAIGNRRHRRMTRARTVDAVAHDLRFALRTLGRQKAWTGVALITLALGVGASTAVFSVVDTLILHPLAYAHADRVASVWREDTKSRMMINPRSNMIDVWRRDARSFESMEPYSPGFMTLTGQGEATQLTSASVLPSFVHFTGLSLVRGRAFSAAEAVKGGARVAIISEAIWRDRFGGAADVLGQKLVLDDKPYTIVGVAPASLRLPGLGGGHVDVWLPLQPDPAGESFENIVVRVKPGVGMAAAARELDSLVVRAGVAEEFSSRRFSTTLARPDRFVGFKSSLYLLSGAVALLLLVACANVAHLLLARGATRERELAIRTALGADRGRLARQLLTESLLLAGAGGALGIAVAYGGVALLAALRPASMSELALAEVNVRALVTAVVISAVTGLAFGLTAAAHAVRRTTSDSLRAASLAGTAAPATHALRSVLVVTELALSAMLLLGAVLLVRSIVNLERIDPGFDTSGLYSATIDLPPARYATPRSRAAFAAQLVARARSIRGVMSVALADNAPPEGGFLVAKMEAEGTRAGNEAPGALAVNDVADNYFATIGLRVTDGASFSEAAGKRGDVIVNQGLARRLWPRERAVGKRLRFPATTPGATSQWHIVVGVVGNIPVYGLSGDPSEPMIYLPFDGSETGHHVALVVRAMPGTDPTVALRQGVASIDAQLPPPPVRAVAAALMETIAGPRFTMLLLAVFASLAVSLSAVGLYGVISYVVTQRTREIGIRIALGATPRQVARSVVARGAALSVAGLAIGLTAAVWGTTLIASSLYGVSPTDPLSYGATAALLLAVSTMACLVPMSRAMRVDPVIAMRSD